jgi:DNA-binding PadR family transcriptional regulator
MSDTVRDILLAFVRVHVLHHAVSQRVYGAGMADELAHHGHRLSPGTLCPLLHRVEQDGLLASEAEVVAGKVRRYYVATGRGRAALAELRPRLAKLVGEALPENESDAPARPRRHTRR